MKSKKEIIEETVAYYAADPVGRRAVNKRCQYITDDGKMCAVGRCLIDPQMVENILSNEDWCGSTWELIEMFGSIDSILQEEYHNHETDFWINLQCFHDNPSYWTETSLSEDGEKKVERLLTQWS